MSPESAATDNPKTKQKIRTRIVGRARAVGNWYLRLWSDLRPGPEARKGAVWGSLAAALAASVIAGWYMEAGFGLWVDLGFCIIVAGLLILISAALVPLLVTIFRRLPRLASGLILGSAVVVVLGFPLIGLLASPVACLSTAFFCAAVASLLPAHFRKAGRKKKIIIVGLFLLSLGAIVGEIMFFSYDGSFDPRKLKRIRLRFDRTAASEILLSKIGFE